MGTFLLLAHSKCIDLLNDSTRSMIHSSSSEGDFFV